MINNICIIGYCQCYISFLTMQGFPTARELLGMSFVTTLPAHRTTLSHILTHLRMVTRAPIQTLFPICISAYFPVFEVLKFDSFQKPWSHEIIYKSDPIMTLSPIIIHELFVHPAEIVQNSFIKKSFPIWIFHWNRQSLPTLNHFPNLI